MTETRSDEEKETGAQLVAFEDVDGPVTALFGDKHGPQVQVYAQPLRKSATTSPTGENSRIVKVQQDNTLLLEEFLVYNNTGGALYAMIFDSETLPANGLVPAVTAITVASGDTVSGELEENGLPFTHGICIVLSTTPLILTIAAATAGSITIFYLPASTI